MFSSLSIKVIATIVAIVAVIGMLWYHQVKLESLVSENTALQLQIETVVQINTDLNSTLTRVTDDYENKLSVLQDMTSKKASSRKDTDSIKRNVIRSNNEKDISIDTARDILSRLREYQSSN